MTSMQASFPTPDTNRIGQGAGSWNPARSAILNPKREIPPINAYVPGDNAKARKELLGKLDRLKQDKTLTEGETAFVEDMYKMATAYDPAHAHELPARFQKDGDLAADKNKIIEHLNQACHTNDLSPEFVNQACAKVHDSYFENTQLPLINDPHHPLVGGSIDDVLQKLGVEKDASLQKKTEVLGQYFKDPAAVLEKSVLFKTKITIGDLKEEGDIRKRFFKEMGKDLMEKEDLLNSKVASGIIVNTVSKPGTQIAAEIRSGKMKGSAGETPEVLQKKFNDLQKDAIVRALAMTRLDELFVSKGVGGISENNGNEVIVDMTHAMWGVMSGWGSDQVTSTSGLKPDIQRIDLVSHQSVVNAGLVQNLPRS